MKQQVRFQPFIYQKILTLSLPNSSISTGHEKVQSLESVDETCGVTILMTPLQQYINNALRISQYFNKMQFRI